MEKLPDVMKAIELTEQHLELETALSCLRVVERQRPSPAWNEVLIKLEAAPCNPSDLLFLQGLYGVKKKLPAVPGWEGCGRVVAAGSPLGMPLLGRRVACGIQGDTDGTWSEYLTVPLSGCIPMGKGLSLEQAATFIVNPLSAWGMLQILKSQGHEVVLQTAAASQLGRLVTHFAPHFGIKVIHVVRRDEQADVIHEIESKAVVLNSSDPSYGEDLREQCKKYHVTAALDAIAGDQVGAIVKALRPGGTVLVYGALSESAVGSVDPVDLIFQGKSIDGFYLGHYMRDLGIAKLLLTTRKLQKVLQVEKIAPTVQQRVDFAEWPAALATYSKKMTDGKVLLVPAQ